MLCTYALHSIEAGNLHTLHACMCVLRHSGWAAGFMGWAVMCVLYDSYFIALKDKKYVDWRVVFGIESEMVFDFQVPLISQ